MDYYRPDLIGHTYVRVTGWWERMVTTTVLYMRSLKDPHFALGIAFFTDGRGETETKWQPSLIQ